MKFEEFVKKRVKLFQMIPVEFKRLYLDCGEHYSHSCSEYFDLDFSLYYDDEGLLKLKRERSF